MFRTILVPVDIDDVETSRPALRWIRSPGWRLNFAS
jgi:hypothetical protein